MKQKNYISLLVLGAFFCIHADKNADQLAAFKAHLTNLQLRWLKVAPKVIPSIYTQSYAHLTYRPVREVINEFYARYFPEKNEEFTKLKNQVSSLKTYLNEQKQGLRTRGPLPATLKSINDNVDKRIQMAVGPYPPEPIQLSLYHGPILESGSKVAFTQELGPLNQYKTLIQDALAKENEYKDTHYVFYHAQDYMMRIPQDLNLALCKLSGKCPKNLNDFIFLRSFDKDYYGFGDLNNWIDTRYQEFRAHKATDPNLKFNNDPSMKPYVLATNIALFGNTGRRDSNTLKYFLVSQSGEPFAIGQILNFIISPYMPKGPQKAHIINVLNMLGIDTATNALKPNQDKDVRDSQTIYTPEGQLLQIFIPKTLVDEIVYLCKEHGTFWPFRIGEISGWNNEKKRYMQASPVLQAFQDQPELFYVEFTDPENKRPPAKNYYIDRLEGRIVLRGEIFNEPTKHNVKMFRYSMLDKKYNLNDHTAAAVEKRENDYRQRINTIAQHIYDASKTKGGS